MADIDDLGIADVVDLDDLDEDIIIGEPEDDRPEGGNHPQDKSSADSVKRDSKPSHKISSHYRKDDDTIKDDDAAEAVKKIDDDTSIERDKLIMETNETFEDRKEAGKLTPEEELQEIEILKHYKKNLWDYIKIGVIYLYLFVTAAFTGIYAYNLVNSVKTLDASKIMPKAGMTLWFIFGILVWLFSTMVRHWTFDIRIKVFFATLLALVAVELAGTFYYLTYKLILPVIIGKVNPWVSKDDWVFLARVVLVVPMLVLTAVCTTELGMLVFNKITFKSLKYFRLSNYVDLRKNKKWLYDTRRVICRASDAKYQVVRENDRYLHSMTIAPTGGGKSTNIDAPMINEDLEQRAKNDDALRKSVHKMLKKGQAYMSGPVGKRDYWIKSIVPVEGYEKKLEKLKQKYRPCGITVMAPDPSTTDDAYLLGIAKGDRVNRLDPLPADELTGKKKTGYIGFNPLYISPNIPEWMHTKEIVKKATLFADVLQSIDDLRGHGDPYFTNLNRCMTVTFIICLEVAYPRLHNGKQPNPAVLRDCINNFENIRPYYRELLRCDKEEKRYAFVTDFIRLDIFGPGQEKMLDQVRGLRNLIDLLLATPSFADLLCVDDEHTLDMDKMLSEGQVTVVDYAYQEGVSDSTGFGLFFMLSFIDAVLRRPGNERTRIPHFFYIDEASLLVTPRLEQAVSLFRKFRCACIFANQSLDQYDRNDATKNLKSVMISGCSQHYIFGRIGPTEMKIYQELAGMRWDISETDSVSETALTTDNPSYTYQKRETLTQENYIEGSDMRYLPFQDITVLSVRNGNLIKPYFAKVDFLPKTKFNKRKRYPMDWDELYKKYSYKNLLPDEETMKKVEKKIPEKVEEVEAVPAGTISVKEDFQASGRMEDTDPEPFAEESQNTAPAAMKAENMGKKPATSAQKEAETEKKTNKEELRNSGAFEKMKDKEEPAPHNDSGYGTNFGENGYDL